MNLFVSKNVLFLTLIVILAVNICTARSTSLADRSLEELFKTSIALVSGKIDSEKSECIKNKCLYHSDIEIEEQIKGELTKSRVSICSLDPLGVQKKYYIFLISGSGEDTYSMQCDYVALADGIIKDDGDQTYYRHMSPNAYGRLVNFEGATYRTFEIEEPLFAKKLKDWKLLSQMERKNRNQMGAEAGKLNYCKVANGVRLSDSLRFHAVSSM